MFVPLLVPIATAAKTAVVGLAAITSIATSVSLIGVHGVKKVISKIDHTHNYRTVLVVHPDGTTYELLIRK